MKKQPFDLPFHYTDIIRLMIESGKYAIAEQPKAIISVKEDRSIVTNVDCSITSKFGNFFAPYPQIAVLDEESHKDQKVTRRVVADTEYTVVIDPIDGTTAFAAGLPYWGHLLSIFKKGQPVFACIYTPSMNDLVYGNASVAFHLKNPATRRVQKTQISVKTPEQDRKGVIQGTDWMIRNRLQCSPTLNLYDAANWVMRSVTGGVQAAVSHKVLKVWDIAAGIVLGQAVGVNLHALKFGQDGLTVTKKITTLDPADYSPCWGIKHETALCTPNVLEQMVKRGDFKLKQNNLIILGK